MRARVCVCVFVILLTLNKFIDVSNQISPTNIINMFLFISTMHTKGKRLSNTHTHTCTHTCLPSYLSTTIVSWPIVSRVSLYLLAVIRVVFWLVPSIVCILAIVLTVHHHFSPSLSLSLLLLSLEQLLIHLCLPLSLSLCFSCSYDGGNNWQLELLCVYITNIGSSLFGISAH